MPQERSPKQGVGRLALLITALVTAVIVGAVAWSAGRLSTINDPTPTATSAEAGFARDMQVHHDQGVELAMIVRDLTDAPDVRLLAFDIATTQAHQSGQMYGWLNEWELSQAGSEPSMTWMTRPGKTDSGHDHTSGDPSSSASHAPGDPMPGLATAEQIAELKAASGVEAERIFLTLMIAHHQGAVDMADAVLDRSDNSVVTAFATSVVQSQTSEIELMQSMLAKRV